MTTPPRLAPARSFSLYRGVLLSSSLLMLVPSWAADPAADAHAAPPVKADIEAKSSSDPKEVGGKVREALGGSILPNKKLTLIVGGKGHGATGALPATATMERPAAAGQGLVSAPTQSGHQAIRARSVALGGHAPGTSAKAHAGEVHWSYEGETGPQAWGQLKPEFNVCAIGKRQSPINIEEGTTLQGPAETLQFNYSPNNAIVVNNGHTIQVDVQGDNSVTVRGSRYRLVQFHFHTPSEEQINYKRSVMVVHLVHKNDAGQLAVVAVLLEPGGTNPLIDKVWTYMPLDAGDRVRMPPDFLNVSELLPIDQRYYQFMGSLTTPPCTEGVLWMVLKQPMPISKSQYKLFSQLYPNNARPVQPVNGRPVRDAQ
jgi:carbonic anhydrase